MELDIDFAFKTMVRILNIIISKYIAIKKQRRHNYNCYIIKFAHTFSPGTESAPIFEVVTSELI